MGLAHIQSYDRMKRDTTPYQLTVDDEAKVYSQHGEDGILAKIESILGDQLPKTFVELGASSTECNTLALRARGWEGVLIDEQGGEGIIPARITRENIDDLLAEHFWWPRCGVLSIDLDGKDYWIVDAINKIHPVVIVVEYNAHFDTDIKVATPFREPRTWTGGCDYSASLNAWISLLAKKWNASLCYVEGSASNAFFVSSEPAKKCFGAFDASSKAAPVPAYSYGDPKCWDWSPVE